MPKMTLIYLESHLFTRKINVRALAGLSIANPNFFIIAIFDGYLQKLMISEFSLGNGKVPLP
jgi:hypothetical protein